ncbi:MAG: DUF3575 domain-containing protein [Rikenellaceae bacterium]
MFRKKIWRPIFLCGLTLMFASNLSHADAQIQQKEQVIKIYFELNESVIDQQIQDNTYNLKHLSSVLNELKTDTLLTMVKINVDSYTSPENGASYNKKLAARRTEAVCEYLTEKEGVSDDLIEHSSTGIAWLLLQDMILNSELSGREQAAAIIDNVQEETWGRVDPADLYPVLLDSRNKHLMDFEVGNPYKYMREHFFPLMRSTNIVITYNAQKAPKVVEPEVVEEVNEAIVEVVEQTPVEEPIEELDLESKKMLFALKTNLVAYIPFIFNIGVEVPLGDKFSLDVPLYYSPYTLIDSYSFRTLGIQPEFRYWFDKSMAGHFVGFHVMGGWYNMAWNSRSRFQDMDGNTPVYGAGFSYGYAKSLKNDRWGIEFNAGLGYAHFHYDVFANEENGVLYKDDTFDYWGITRLSVNLIYKLNRK